MHKYLKNNTANLVNYMSKSMGPASTDHTFYGFVPISTDDYNWGVELDGQAFCAVHVLQKSYNPVSDEESKEQEAITKGYIFPVIFYGSDNASYVMRFKLATTRDKFLKELEEFNRFEETCYYYNS